MFPTKSFISQWGHEVKALTILADRVGLVSLLDVEGHILANCTVNSTLGFNATDVVPPYSPMQIIEPQQSGDNYFSILSDSRLDTFKVKFAGERGLKTVTITQAWAKSLE